MTTLTTDNPTIENIVHEVEQLDTLQQKAILAYIRAKRLKSSMRKPLADYPKTLKPLNMAAIDSIKHKSRKTSAHS